MAVIESLGLEVSLVMRGQPLPEYDDPDADDLPRETTGGTIISNRYVEAQDGEEFLILLRSKALLPPTEEGSTSLDYVLLIDGSQEAGTYGDYDFRNPGGLRVLGKMFYPPGSAATLRKFRFSAISVGNY